MFCVKNILLQGNKTRETQAYFEIRRVSQMSQLTQQEIVFHTKEKVGVKIEQYAR